MGESGALGGAWAAYNEPCRYIFTGSLAVGGMMAVSNTLIGLSCYVIYERVWSGISWGRQDRNAKIAHDTCGGDRAA